MSMASQFVEQVNALPQVREPRGQKIPAMAIGRAIDSGMEFKLVPQIDGITVGENAGYEFTDGSLAFVGRRRYAGEIPNIVWGSQTIDGRFVHHVEEWPGIFWEFTAWEPAEDILALLQEQHMNHEQARDKYVTGKKLPDTDPNLGKAVDAMIDHVEEEHMRDLDEEESHPRRQYRGRLGSLIPRNPITGESASSETA